MSQGEERHSGGLERIPAYSRFIVGVPVVGLFASAATLVVLAAVTTVRTIIDIAQGTLDKKEAMFEFIELADTFLLATVLYVMALGLYELFINDHLPVPAWLEIHTLDDLKSKLIGVIVVVLAVLFLGSVIAAESPEALAYRGVGIAAVIAALGFFLGRKAEH